MAYTVAFPQSGSSSAGIQVISGSDIEQDQGDSPTLFEKCSGFFKVPHIGLADVGRLGQWLNVPTQGWRVHVQEAQTGDERPFSLTVPESDAQPGVEPGSHWWEAKLR